MFTSRRKNNTGNKIDDFDSKYFEDMFLAHRNNNNKFIDAHPFSQKDLGLKEIINTKAHDAVVSLSHSNNKFYIYRKNKIYESEYINNEWSTPKTLGDSINLSSFQTHICISHDGKTVYFSAEIPNGFGSVDIYKSEKSAAGKWSVPINLGKEINSSENEESPFLSEDGQTLYFSSKGHEGYGGYDIYKSTLVNGKWSNCKNLGIPFNSSGDDIYLTIDKNETRGYFSSSRSGGYGDMDIYEVVAENPFEKFFADGEGRLKISAPDTFYIGEKATLGVTSTKLSPSVFKRYYWQINDSILIADGEIASYTFSKTGETRVRVVGLTGENDLIGYEKKVVVANRRIIALATNTTVATHTTSAVGSNTVSGSSGLDNVYFAFNENRINSEARAVLLNNLKFLNDNPGITISVAAYCDSRGSASYNQALSEKRARNVIWYLCKHGLDRKRVSQVTWFGEKDPLNKCIDGTPCTAGEYKINRRVEFKVYLDSKK